VGAIVVLSTIVILIDADKKLIGTMKAFGFRNWEIIVGYLAFAVTASIFGMLLSIGLSAILQGILAAHHYPLFYVNPVGMAFHWKTYALLFAVQVGISAAVAVAGTIVNATAYSALSLMDGSAGKKAIRKKAKAGGKGGLYTRLILRNMRTDLVRVLTSIVIIAGSCLLMGMGVTLRDSFHRMMPLSAAEVNHYDLEVTVTERAQEGDYNRVRDYLSAQGVDYAEIRKTATIYRAGDTEEFLNVISADEGVYPDYIELVDEAGKNAYRLEESDVLLCNRIAENTGLEAGGEMLLYDEDYQPHILTVNGVCRNYLGRTLYLSKKAYEGVYGEAPENNTFLVRVERDQRDAFREKLESRFNALSLSYTDDLPDTLVGLRSNYDIIVVVVTALAILMSVFVLLNLVNIFVRRRQNEVIIMVVNGFSWLEQRDYLLRETIVMTAVGLLLGALAGTLLTNPLVRIVESAETMFDRGFNPRAWVFAWVLEILFAVIINWLAYRRVRHLKLTDLTK
jgi:putative ABC transport system permease protein